MHRLCLVCGGRAGTEDHAEHCMRERQMRWKAFNSSSNVNFRTTGRPWGQV